VGKRLAVVIQAKPIYDNSKIKNRRFCHVWWSNFVKGMTGDTLEFVDK